MGAPDNDAELAGTLTRLIGRIDAGDEAARAEFCKRVYDELLAIGQRIHRRGPQCSLASTDVVHEFLGAFISDGRLGQMKNRRYFYAVAARQMHQLLIERWRHNQTAAAGGRHRRQQLDPWLDELVDSAASRCGGDLEALEIALARLKKERPRQYEIVQLKFFGGLTNEQVAQALDLSIDTVKRDWRIARARLGACLTDKS